MGRVIAKEFSKLKKKDFESFERVRKEGCFNMITEARDAASFAGLSIETYMGVIKNYDQLMEKYPDVRK
jgi:hypothetical protein